MSLKYQITPEDEAQKDSLFDTISDPSGNLATDITQQVRISNAPSLTWCEG